MHERDSEVVQLCLILSDPMDCSPPGSPVPGIFQARVLESGAIAFSVAIPRMVLILILRSGSALALLRASIPRQVDKKSLVPKEEKGVQGPGEGERGTRGSQEEEKDKHFFPTLLGLSQYNNVSCSRIYFSITRIF